MHAIHQCHGDKLMIYCEFFQMRGGGDIGKFKTLESVRCCKVKNYTISVAKNLANRGK